MIDDLLLFCIYGGVTVIGIWLETVVWVGRVIGLGIWRGIDAVFGESIIILSTRGICYDFADIFWIKVDDERDGLILIWASPSVLTWKTPLHNFWCYCFFAICLLIKIVYWLE